MDTAMCMFVGASLHGDSTLMPNIRTWVREVMMDVSTSPTDACLVLWLNCPTASIMSATKQAFFVSVISNMLNDYKGNAVAIVIAPNQAGQPPERTGCELVRIVLITHLNSFLVPLRIKIINNSI